MPINHNWPYLRSRLNWSAWHDDQTNQTTFQTDIMITSDCAVEDQILNGPDGILAEKAAKQHMTDMIAHRMLGLLEINSEDRAKMELVQDIPYKDLALMVGEYKFTKGV